MTLPPKTRCARAATTLLLLMVAPVAWGAPKVEVTQQEDGATVLLDGEVFTRYLTRSGTRPVLWPVVGPTGDAMTRAYPVGPKGEKDPEDHCHHRSIWFGYEGINGLDFWHEPCTGKRPLPFGDVRHLGFLEVRSDGDRATIATRNEYVALDSGRRVATDERTLEFGAEGGALWIDVRIGIRSVRGPLRFNDTKEGALAIRVAPTMAVDAKLGGTFANSRGQVDGKAWGQPAEWVDYTGPVGGETVGFAILSHPSSYHPAPRWHVREYGLFAANPFGERPYGGEEAGGATFPENQVVHLRYRVVIHRGTTAEADIAGVFARYAQSR